MRLTLRNIRASLSVQDGFTMMLVLSVMLVTSLLLVAGYTATNGDIQESHRDTVQKQAYYAALAGVQKFEYEMQTNPNYWQGCPTPSSELPEEPDTHFEVKILPATHSPSKECVPTNAFKTAIESTGATANTFRVRSIGCAGPKEIVTSKCPNTEAGKGKSLKNVSTHEIIATFQVIGFLNFVYFTNHEIEDPSLYEGPSICSNTHAYYPETKACNIIQFATGDSVKGPMHTNDAVCVGGSAAFGREGHSPADTVEFYRALNTECGGTGKYNTSSGKFSKGESMEPPESDGSLETYALEENEFTGVTHLVLNGSTNTISVTNGGVPKEIPWPSNGLLWVKGSSTSSCPYKYEPHETDDLFETTNETNCGTVYVHGTYSKSLTIASSDDVIINGSLTPTGVTLGSEPSGSATLGLIANNYVRIYHPVEETYTIKSGSKCKSQTYQGDYGNSRTIEDKEKSPAGSDICEYTNEAHYFGSEEVDACNAPNASGSLTSPWVYAAILSTLHSFIVDNFSCGAKLENLNVYGAIAQNYRGIVGTSGNTGYIKNYNYDERLAVDEPPYFLAPLKAGWKVARETSPTTG
jgi:Tfp pilus assembly protein PilE